MGQVFISYSRTDFDFAENAARRIGEAGLGYWMDRKIQGGDEWRTEIDHAIWESVAVLAVISPESRKSEYVTYEWSFALGAGRAVVPLMLCKTDLHPRMAAIQYLDFTNPVVRPWDDLIAVLQYVDQRVMGIWPPAPSTTPRPTTPPVMPLLDTIVLNRGCNAVLPSVTEAASAFAARINPVATLVVIWQDDPATGVRTGFARALGAPNDLPHVTRGRPVLVCVSAPAILTQPSWQ